jgi:hypothetical protein
MAKTRRSGRMFGQKRPENGPKTIKKKLEIPENATIALIF